MNADKPQTRRLSPECEKDRRLLELGRALWRIVHARALARPDEDEEARAQGDEKATRRE
jgi:hypothetical protein